MEPLLKDKKNEDIGKLFDDISSRYDFLNHFLSFNIDKNWREKLVFLMSKDNPVQILDVATGTADLAILAVSKISGSHITGIDISEKMLEKGRLKVIRFKLENDIELIYAPAENLPFADNTFDTAMVAFGVRNFQNLGSGLKEMLRVIKPGKKIYILEFSKPRGGFKLIYMIYFRLFLPVIGYLISGNKTAYRYLRDSVIGFPDNKAFLDIMQQAGCNSLMQKRLNGGIATIYIGEKQKNI